MERIITVHASELRFLATILCLALNEFSDFAAVEGVPPQSLTNRSKVANQPVLLRVLPNTLAPQAREQRAGYRHRPTEAIDPTSPQPIGFSPVRTALILCGTVREIGTASAQGFRNFLCIDDSPREMYRGVLAASRCEDYCSSTFMPCLAEALALKSRPRETDDHGIPREELSPRELQVAELAATGVSNAEIAERISVVESTVKAHLNEVYKKLEISRRTQLRAMLNNS